MVTEREIENFTFIILYSVIFVLIIHLWAIFIEDSFYLCLLYWVGCIFAVIMAIMLKEKRKAYKGLK